MKSSSRESVLVTTGASDVPRLHVNIFANMAGRASSTLVTILLTPLYIRLLGMEAYGLIGFYLTLQVSIGFMEMGLSRACTRELSRFSGQNDEADQVMLNSARSLEVLYWAIAIFLGISLTLAAPWIATYWLRSSEFSPAQLTGVLTIVAWVIALRWPMGLYIGMLMGMQRHVKMNVAQVAIAVLNGGGAVLVLLLLSPSIEAYFQWQVISALFSVAFLARLAWGTMPGSFTQAIYSFEILKGLMRFAAAVGLNAVLGTVLRQADKLILSAMLPLKQFSYYALVSLIVGIVPMVVETISNATFPRLSRLVGSEASTAKISTLYNLTSQVVAALIVPISIAIAIFPEQVLYIYMGNPDVTAGAAQTLSVLVIAKMLHSSMIIPYALQMAYGWVKLSLYINIVAVIWLIPAIVVLVGLYGSVGAALAWLVVTIGYVTVGMPLMHRKLLVGEWPQWVWNCLLKPLLAVCVFWLIVRFWLGDISGGRLWQGVVLGSLGSTSAVIASLFLDELRKRVLHH